jgi:hypothetical protein
MALLYFHDSSCISPQQTFPVADISVARFPENNILEVTEPEYSGIPAGILRRMGKAIRMGVGASLPLLKNNPVNGIIIGTANGGMEDCIKFLNQIIEYNEGRLTPGNFVGSTANAIASQIGLLSANKGYNNTHVQSGLSFENALLDAAMVLKEKKDHNYLVGGVDEISAYNYNIDKLAGWYKHLHTEYFYDETEGNIPGEGAAVFIVNNDPNYATGSLEGMDIFHTENENEVAARVKDFIDSFSSDSRPVDLIITGENGDIRYKKFYQSWKSLTGTATVARFKHISGEYATASAVAVWIALQLLNDVELPEHMLTKPGESKSFTRILIVNHYKKNQHSLMMVGR